MVGQQRGGTKREGVTTLKDFKIVSKIGNFAFLKI
jgi:hypothetical protein